MSFALRLVWIANPSDLIFDEVYYVNAARTLDGIRVPPGEPYAGSPSGIDPNAEHGPLGKVMIAASIEVFGDRPLGWRLPSVFFGTACIALMYWFARAAAAGKWVAVGSAALMAADNLFLVHGRIGTLDIFAVAFMLAGAIFYLRRRPLAAGAVLGIGACVKLICLYALLALVVLELVRWWSSANGRASKREDPAQLVRRVAACGLAFAIAYLVLLGGLDRAATNFPDPIAHTRYMFDFAEHLTDSDIGPARATSSIQISATSHAWQWLADEVPINYYRHRAAPPGQPGGNRVLVYFQGRMTPFIIWFAVPAFLLAAHRAWVSADEAAAVAVSWCLGTFLPFLVFSLRGRVGYLYYMLPVLPGIFLALALGLSRRFVPRFAVLAYGSVVAVSFMSLFPFRTWGGQ